MENEIWLPVKGFEGLYEVSSLGRVRSLGNDKSRKTKVLSPAKDRGGYFKVCLSKNGKHKNFMVHRLVATAFLPNWFDDEQVNHRDENKENNHVDNLEWCDAKYNDNFGTRNVRISKERSKTVLQLKKTGALVKEWSSTIEVGRNGFSGSAVVNCCNGKRQSHKGFIWRYKESA